MGLRDKSFPRLAAWSAGDILWAPLVQDFTSRALPSPAQALRDGLAAMSECVRPGDRVAVAVGSRGISSIVEVCQSLIGWLTSRGASPFIVPAMGSHGGGTAEGQVAVLASLGITEAAMGAPIMADMATVPVGTLDGGITVYTDKLAAAADLVIPVSRVKPHTDFRGKIESGPAKMLTIGLGHRDGAEAIHAVGLSRLSETIAEAGQLLIRVLRVPFCVAIVEDALDAAAIVEVVPSEALESREPELLDLARAWMPYFPVSELDVLVVQEMGKDISGNGMDPNITGRFYDPRLTARTGVDRLVVLDLTRHTGGNATGIGMADIVTTRLAGKIDWHQTYTNDITSGTPVGVRLPLVAIDDEEAFAIAVRTLGVPPRRIRLGWIQNTLRLSRLMVSEPVLGSVAGDVRVLARPEPIRFAGGELVPPAFPL